MDCSFPVQYRDVSDADVNSSLGNPPIRTPLFNRSTASVFCSPKASRTIRFASSIVWMPIVIAFLGTASSEGKYFAFTVRVDCARSTACVRERKDVPGSLKPIWPFTPMPSNCRSIRRYFESALHIVYILHLHSSRSIRQVRLVTGKSTFARINASPYNYENSLDALASNPIYSSKLNVLAFANEITPCAMSFYKPFVKSDRTCPCCKAENTVRLLESIAVQTNRAASRLISS